MKKSILSATVALFTITMTQQCIRTVKYYEKKSNNYCHSIGSGIEIESLTKNDNLRIL